MKNFVTEFLVRKDWRSEHKDNASKKKISVEACALVHGDGKPARESSF